MELAVLAGSVAVGCDNRSSVERIRPSATTFSNMIPAEARPRLYLGEGQFTSISIPGEFFGSVIFKGFPCKRGLLLQTGRLTHLHCVSIGPCSAVRRVREVYGRDIRCRATTFRQEMIPQ